MGMPSNIYILRHAEKSENSDDEYLSIKGYERAAALAYYLPDRFDNIEHIFAAGIGAHSNSHRPVQTVTPLATRLNKKIHQEFLKDEYQDMTQHILNDPKYNNTNIVVCWQHTLIEDIANNFGAIDVPSAKWPGVCFDLVWHLSNNQNGGYTLNQIPQLLLYGDTLQTIPYPQIITS